MHVNKIQSLSKFDSLQDTKYWLEIRNSAFSIIPIEEKNQRSEMKNTLRQAAAVIVQRYVKLVSSFAQFAFAIRIIRNLLSSAFMWSYARIKCGIYNLFPISLHCENTEHGFYKHDQASL